MILLLIGVAAALDLFALWCLLASAKREDRRMAREWERWR